MAEWVYKVMCQLKNRNQLPVKLQGHAIHLMRALVSIFVLCMLHTSWYMIAHVWTHRDPFLNQKLWWGSGGSWGVNVQTEKYLEKKSWLFVKDFSSLGCVLQVHIHYLSFLYFLSVLCINFISTEYALHYRERYTNIALKREIIHWDGPRIFQEFASSQRCRRQNWKESVEIALYTCFA